MLSITLTNCVHAMKIQLLLAVRRVIRKEVRQLKRGKKNTRPFARLHFSSGLPGRAPAALGERLQVEAIVCQQTVRKALLAQTRLCLRCPPKGRPQLAPLPM